MSIHLNISWVRAANKLGIDLNMRREIPYLQATMYYFVYYIISIGFSWQENSTKDLELRMVNALPFICQTDREAQIDDIKQIKNYKIYAFPQGWKSLLNTAIYMLNNSIAQYISDSLSP